MTTQISSSQHSVHALHFHLVLVVKYRRKAINDDISKRLEEIFMQCGKSYGISKQEWNHDKDHIHVLFSTIPLTNLSKFISCYKSMSSRIIKSEFPCIRKKLWKSHFWSASYCILSTGGATIDIIKQYIENQGEK